MTPRVVYQRVNRPSRDDVAALRGFSVASLQAAMGGGNLLGRSLVSIPGSKVRMCGPVVTAVAWVGDNLASHCAVRLAEPGDVVVVTSFGDTSVAQWGELMSLSAQLRGIDGAIIDGAIRDIAGIRSLGFPIWARAVCPRTAVKETLVAANVPIVVEGVRICPGDVVVADEDGIVVVPRKTIGAVLQRTAAGDAAEEVVHERLGSGELYWDFAGGSEKLRARGINELDMAFPD